MSNIHGFRDYRNNNNNNNNNNNMGGRGYMMNPAGYGGDGQRNA